MATTLFVIAAIAVTTLLLALLLIRWSVRRPRWTRRVGSWLGLTAGTLLASLAALALVGVYLDTRASEVRGMPSAEEWEAPVPAVSFRTVAEDRPAALSTHAGDVVLLNLWATWCGPCLKEMPTLDRLQAELGDRGLVVVTLTNDDREKVLEFADRLPERSVNVYADEDDLPPPFSRAFRNLPLTYVIDRDGRFRDVFVGTRSFDAFRKKVEPLL